MDKQFYLTTGAVGTDLFERIRQQEAEILELAEAGMPYKEQLNEMRKMTNNFLDLTKPINKNK